jgi:hypothetical protein
MILNLKCKSPVIAGLFFILIFVIQSKAADLPIDCQIVNPWLKVASKPPSSKDPIETWGNYQHAQATLQISAAREIFHRYLKKQWNNQNSEKLAVCLTPDQRRELDWAIQSVFWNGTLEILEKSGGAKKEFVNQTRGSGFQMFKMVGYFDEKSPDGKKGGFDRGNKQLFLDFSQIPANEWFIIFIHEVSHSLDPYLIGAVEAFGNEKTHIDILKMAHRTDNPDDLSLKEKEEIFNWIRAGLDRGFLAEYRAWTVSFKLYLEGKNTLWTSIDWMEDISKYKRSNERLETFILRFLDPRFTNPSDDLFALPLVKKSLILFRKSLLTGEAKAPLGGALQQIYKISEPNPFLDFFQQLRFPGY